MQQDRMYTLSSEELDRVSGGLSLRPFPPPWPFPFPLPVPRWPEPRPVPMPVPRPLPWPDSRWPMKIATI